ncbi:unnamed protein product [Rhizoctonia solani]|uniref:WD40 repeat-like protein n=1 Tax=Rhizoctonia solani TaxID=456999 RepID=A0A8H3EBQ2_9AGAM|nr:unnamed protein product [Rhizoctonia solani]
MSLAFSPDGTRIVTASLDGTARVWNIHSTAEPFVFRGHKGKVRSVAFAPDGSFIVSGGTDTMVRMWNPSTGEPLLDPLEGHTDEIKSVTVSRDGTSIASGSADKTICVWDIGAEIASTLRVITGHTGKVWSVAFSPDGTKLASCSSDGTVRLWNPRDGSPIGEPIKVYDENKIIASIAFSPGGDYIAWGSADSTIRMWDLSKGEYVGQPFEGHRDTVWSVAFAPGGTHIASGSYDGTIRIWNTQKRTPWADEDDDPYGDWVLERNGWIKRGKDLLLWVPHEIARSLLTPHCCSVISSCGSLHLDLKNVALGDQWQSCLAPQPAEQFNLHEYVSDLPCVCFILT